MAKIEVVDYNDMAQKAKKMRTDAQDLNKEFLLAYQHIIDMHKSWYGVRYNELAKSFNENLAPTIHEMLKLTVTEVPFTLERVANNYSRVAERSKVTSEQETEYKKMTQIPRPIEVGTRFMTQEVENAKKSVEDNFERAKTKMNQIQDVFNRITWRSEAADSFRENFTRLKKQITENISQIMIQFRDCMQKALDDYEAAERANNIKK